jgi:hypothetical protein
LIADDSRGAASRPEGIMGSCFVIMGFNEKTDFQSNPQRLLNLDKTYENIIKPAIEEAGLSGVRADEIIHSSVIDKPMYENLLSADLVVADLLLRTSTQRTSPAFVTRFAIVVRPPGGSDRDGNAMSWMEDTLNDQLKNLGALLTP